MRELVYRASLVAIPATIACCFNSHSVSLLASRTKYAMRIDACIADSKTCQALCESLLYDDPTASMYDTVDVDSCTLSTSNADGATFAIDYNGSYECGRRTRGLVEPVRRDGTAGAWLAAQATLEAASVTAFARLARALVRLDAPVWAVASARAAIADELWHAQLCAGLARVLGADVAPPEIDGDDDLSLHELARENAVEGEVGETFGALVAACQSRAAHSPVARAVFERIARDELRHAILAHRLAPWLAERLSPGECADVEARRRAAVETTCARDGDALPDRERAWLGLPPGRALAAAARVLYAA